MRYLLDTHTVLWLAENSSRLSRIAARTILDTNNTMYISIASAWEVAIKCALNKLRLEGGVSEFFKVADENGFILLPIEKPHLERVQSLPVIHRDPFDRLIVATVLAENMAIISADENIPKYGIPCVW